MGHQKRDSNADAKISYLKGLYRFPLKFRPDGVLVDADGKATSSDMVNERDFLIIINAYAEQVVRSWLSLAGSTRIDPSISVAFAYSTASREERLLRISRSSPVMSSQHRLSMASMIDSNSSKVMEMVTVFMGAL